MWSLKNNRIWFLLVPVATALLVWAPYLIWNLLTHQALWWRIPIVSATVFDTPAYLQWLGQTINGIEIGGHIRWFVWPLRALARLVPTWSVAEIWLLSRWISITMALWLMDWAIKKWSDLDASLSRLIAIAGWISFVIALGQRPGVFSWYLPMGIFSLAAPLAIIARLKERKIVSAFVWTVAVVAISTVYTWFMIFAVVWLTAIWAEWMIIRSRKYSLVALSAVIVGSALATPAIAAWLVSSPGAQLLMDLQLKSGLGFTHLPQITNSFVAMLAWIAFFIFASRDALRGAEVASQERAVSLGGAWFALLLSWLITPFTGIYLHNDHFRMPALLLSWMSLAVWWSWLRKNEIKFSRLSLWGLSAIFALALIFIVKIILGPYAFNYDDLNILLFSNWFTVALACLLAFGHKRTSLMRAWPYLTLIGAGLIGLVGAFTIYQREFAELPHRYTNVQAVEWIRKNIPPQDNVCADPSQAELLATFTGRKIFPAGTTLYFREQSLDTLRHMQAYASGFDVLGSGDLDYISYVNYMGRSMVCQQFLPQTKLLKVLGFSPARIDEISGCPRELMRMIDVLTQAMVKQIKVDELAFRAICPWALISSDKRAFWRLPNDYVEIPIDSKLSAWRLK